MHEEGAMGMELVARGSQMQKVLEQAKWLASREHPLLLVGEAGTGKELLARYIHHRSGRSDGPFVAVDCRAGLPEGVWDEAAGGTLYLEEIDGLPLPDQERLLEVMRGAVVGPGGTVPDFRLIASSTIDLPYMRANLCEPLGRALAAGRILLPALRDRKEEIQPLTEAILARLAGGKPVELTADAIGALLLYDWPGNVAELEGALERALARAAGGCIDAGHLPPEVAACLQPPPPRPLFRRYMKSAERLLLRWGLARCDGDRSRAAKFLGLSRAALYKKLKEYPELQAEG
jgi:DNA-binding NtrC family response regulator